MCISVLHSSHAALILLPTACNLEKDVIFHVFKNLPTQLPEDVVRACDNTLVIFYLQSGKSSIKILSQKFFKNLKSQFAWGNLEGDLFCYHVAVLEEFYWCYPLWWLDFHALMPCWYILCLVKGENPPTFSFVIMKTFSLIDSWQNILSARESGGGGVFLGCFPKRGVCIVQELIHRLTDRAWLDVDLRKEADRVEVYRTLVFPLVFERDYTFGNWRLWKKW